MYSITRRTFLQATAAIASGQSARVDAPDITFPKEPRDRLSVASYPFRNLMERRQHPGIKLTEFAAMVADKFGIHNIEPLGDHFLSTGLGYLEELRRSVEQAHSRIVNIPAGVGASLYDPDPAKRDMAVNGGLKWVDVAVEVGSPSVRLHVQGARGGPDVGRATDALKKVADYAARKKVVVNLENDDLISEEAFFVAKVIDGVNSPWVHALPDFCNSMLKGDEEYNYKAVDAMFHRAYCIAHVKDSEIEGKKVFKVDVAKTFAIAKAAGYRGYFSMEWEGDGGPYEGTQKLIDESLKALS